MIVIRIFDELKYLDASLIKFVLGTFFLSAGYVQSIPELEKIFQENRGKD